MYEYNQDQIPSTSQTDTIAETNVTAMEPQDQSDVDQPSIKPTNISTFPSVTQQAAQNEMPSASVPDMQPDKSSSPQSNVQPDKSSALEFVMQPDKSSEPQLAIQPGQPSPQANTSQTEQPQDPQYTTKPGQLSESQSVIQPTKKIPTQSSQSQATTLPPPQQSQHPQPQHPHPDIQSAPQKQPQTPQSTNQAPTQSSPNEVKTDKEFSYSGFQVVRGAFFAHLFEPSVTFKSEKVYVNAACIRRLPTVDFVQFLVHPDKKILAVRPCTEDTQDSFRWCSSAPTISKRKAKAITCKIFFYKVMNLMKWNPDYRYKIIGKLVCTPSDKIFVFDLTNAEAFRKKTADDTAATSNNPLYPDSWMDSFGIPVDEHHSDFNLKIFDEDAVFTMKKEPEKPQESPPKTTTQDNNPANNIEKEVQS